METVHKFEEMMAGWYKAVPHLPTEARRWIAQNVWWMTLIGVICGAIALISTFFFTLLAGAALTALGGGIGAMLGIVIFIGILTSVILGIVCIVLGGMAIAPLRAMKKKGWTLIFITLLVEVAAIVITNVLSFNILALIWSLLWAAVGGYFLFELREYFEPKASGRKKVTAHQK
jgi:hypothetical protein